MRKLLQLHHARGWLLALLFISTPLLAFAQNTGKLTGRVLDGDTGDPLPGASVALVGTTLGTVTDIDGNYFIIGVPVGTYDVQASFVGYQTVTVTSLDINSGYTREQDFTLSSGVELDEIVVEYERPLIQKDAIGAPKVVTSEQIVNLPVRGAASVAAIQAGVVNQEGSNTLNVRGGRGAEVTYFIDGVKVIGSTAVPQAAIQEQEMLIGNISARFGDAMSGVINITTKSGAQNFFGSIEGITSEVLDPFGYNLASLTIGGPLVGNKVSFFAAAEFTDEGDSDPRAIDELRISDGLLQSLRAAPQSFPIQGADGTVRAYAPIPGTMADNATLPVDDDGNLVIADNGSITASDGTVIQIPGYDPENDTVDLLPVGSADILTADQFETDAFKRGRERTRLSLNGNLSFSLTDQIRLRLGGRYVGSEAEEFGGAGGIGNRHVVFAPEMQRVLDRDDIQVFGTWTHYLSNSTFYQLQFDYTDRKGENYNPRFGSGPEQQFRFGDIDDPTNSVLRGYKNLSLVDTERITAAGDTVTVGVPTYTLAYNDGSLPNSQTTAGLLTPMGGYATTYTQFHNQQIRFSATATTQIGLHQLEFGGEFEQQTNRFYSIGSGQNEPLARWFSGDDEQEQSLGIGDTYQNYSELPFQPFESSTGRYGYNYLGTEEVDDEDLTGYANDCGAAQGERPANSCYDVAPWKPIYYGGYIQDKIEFRDIVLNLGLRVDVFDNNTRVFRDVYSRLPIIRGADVDAPANIGDDYAVYYSGDDIVGYREDNNNVFFDANGQETQAANILLNGKPRQTDNVVTEDVYEDYKPQVTLMPRIGVSFPVTDQALFFARYGVVSQRPSTNNFASLAFMARTTGARFGNNGLEPEKTTEYELGFRQRVGARSALTISGFFRQIDNLIQLWNLPEAFPQGTSTYQNRDFGTVKGLEFGFDMRRTNNISINANYTLSFAAGTGSSSTTTTTSVWINETPPNFVSPLNFDERHRMNVSVDYRLGKGEGPTVGGAKLLENFGVNVLFTANSGRPYTPQTEPFDQTVSRAANPTGSVNGVRNPWNNRVDLRIDRRFEIGDGRNLSAFLWVQNLFDVNNVLAVWRASGLADNDGYLATAGGSQFLASREAAAETLYNHRNARWDNYGIPRLVRLGVRLDF